MKTLLRFGRRINSNFLMSSRLDEYRALIDVVLSQGYRVVSIREAARLQDQLGQSEPHLILRHDVDTDPMTAAEMFEIDRKLGVQSSYYFRLSTLHVPLMQEIEGSGSEASYHYEELASAIKATGAGAADIPRIIDTAQRQFSRNLLALRARTSLPMTTVAAHGDFINRRLGFSNAILLDDEELRRALGIEHEAYDKALQDRLDARITDGLPPPAWIGGHPLTAVHQGQRIIYLLVHPRWWKARIGANAKDDWVRLVEGITYSIRARTLVKGARGTRRPRGTSGD